MVTKVNSLLENPHRLLPIKKKEKLIVESPGQYTGGKRQYYTLYHHIKSYSSEQRFAHLRKYFYSIFSTYGFGIFKYKSWQHLSRACFGSSIKRVMVLKPRMTIDTVPLVPTTLPVKDKAKTALLKKELRDRNINLSCNPAPLTEPNHTRPEVIEAYFKEAAEQRWCKENHDEWIGLHRKFFKEVDKITFSELNQSLWLCSQKLNELLGENPYSIGFVPGKSQQWIAELALPYLQHSPASSFQHATDSTIVKRGYQSTLKKGERDFVVFDDGSYTAAQLATIMQGMRSAVGAVNEQQKCHLYLVVPFMSSLALQFLEGEGKQDVAVFESLKEMGHLKVHIITTDRKIKAITDVFSEKERERLIELEGSKVLVDYGDGRKWTKCLTYMEWKVPDNASMPDNLKIWYTYNREKNCLVEKDRFITNHKPPYQSAISKH